MVTKILNLRVENKFLIEVFTLLPILQPVEHCCPGRQHQSPPTPFPVFSYGSFPGIDMCSDKSRILSNLPSILNKFYGASFHL